MGYYITYCVIFFLIQTIGYTQNLVPNPGFEEYRRCPRFHSSRPIDFKGLYWHSCSEGTPDYYHRCSQAESAIPMNWAGESQPHSGEAYAGIYVWTANQEYAEYLQCKLDEPLKKGVTYVVQFYFRLSSYSVYHVNRMSYLLTDLRLQVKNDEPISMYHSGEQFYPIDQMGQRWHLFKHLYRAQGGERFLVIGSFVSRHEIKKQRYEHLLGISRMLSSAAYSYIDDVSVQVSDVQLPPPKPEPKFFSIDKVKLGVTYRLRYVYFDFDSEGLHEKAISELQDVIHLVEENPDWNIELDGHTDDIGSDEYNQILSEKRAQNVAQFIIRAGADSTRFRIKGYGKDKPLEDNITDEARMKNRRVEIRFSTSVDKTDHQKLDKDY